MYQTPKPSPDPSVYSTVEWTLIIIGMIIIGVLLYQYLAAFTANLPDPNLP